MDALGHPRSALVVGGSSELAQAILRALVGDRPCRVVLAGRDRERTLAAGAWLDDEPHYVRFDADDPATWSSCVDEATADGDVDLVIVAHGLLRNDDDSWQDPVTAATMARVNYGSATAVLAAVAARIRTQGHGTVVVLSSVAGERVRRSNFVYGAAKAGLDAFARNLGQALEPHGGRVVVVRPGFVHTRMTEGRDPAPLSTTPEVVGQTVAAAIRAGRDEVWAPSALRWVMWVFRHLPEPLFRRVTAGR